MLRLVLVLAFAALVPFQSMAQNRLARSAEIDAYLRHAIETTKILVVAMVADADGILYRGVRPRRRGERQADGGRFDLPARVDDEARHFGCRDDARRARRRCLDDPIARYLPGVRAPRSDRDVQQPRHRRSRSGPRRRRSRFVTYSPHLGARVLVLESNLAALIGGDPTASAGASHCCTIRHGSGLTAKARECWAGSSKVLRGRRSIDS